MAKTSAGEVQISLPGMTGYYAQLILLSGRVAFVKNEPQIQIVVHISALTHEEKLSFNTGKGFLCGHITPLDMVSEISFLRSKFFYLF